MRTSRLKEIWDQYSLLPDTGPTSMPSPKHKYYVVWKGRRSGIYSTWEQCSAQVTGFTGARYKSFASRAEAEEAYAAGKSAARTRIAAVAKRVFGNAGPLQDSIAVDAACSGNPGRLEYRGVHTSSGEVIFHEGPFEKGTNNIGEFLAIVQALQWQKKKQLSQPIYTDSAIGIKWVRRKACKTTLKQDSHNAKLFKLITQAEQWLRENPLEAPLLKWETRQWGEIPADFGRK